MPMAADSHIHTRAPGPPQDKAVATPAILPVPMVADRAVQADWKGVIFPGSFPSLFREPAVADSQVGMPRNWKPRDRTV